VVRHWFTYFAVRTYIHSSIGHTDVKARVGTAYLHLFGVSLAVCNSITVPMIQEVFCSRYYSQCLFLSFDFSLERFYLQYGMYVGTTHIVLNVQSVGHPSRFRMRSCLLLTPAGGGVLGRLNETSLKIDSTYFVPLRITVLLLRLEQPVMYVGTLGSQATSQWYATS
jgi:hypothetical protein